jgi:hypothetical protein
VIVGRNEPEREGRSLPAGAHGDLDDDAGGHAADLIGPR